MRIREAADARTPVVQLALVGAPNVGKSSLVNVLSSGVPEVCDYPFTTRSIKMGHFYVNGQRHQVSICHSKTTSRLDKFPNAFVMLLFI